MGEIKLEQYLRVRVKKLGGLCIKFTSPSMRGVPDRIIFSANGIVYLVELKFGNNTLSAAQRAFLKLMEDRGRTVYVLSSKEEVDNFIDNIYF